MVNEVDVVVAVVLGFLALQGFRAGLVAGMLHMSLAILTLLAGGLGYGPGGELLRQHLGLDAPLAQVAAFSGAAVLAAILGGLALQPVWNGVAWLLDRVRLLRGLDHVLGVAPPVLAGAVLISAMLPLLPLVLPYQPQLRDTIEQSWWTRTARPHVAALSPPAKEVLLRLANVVSLDLEQPTLVAPTASQDLPIPPGVSLSTHEADEQRLLELVNTERTRAGLTPLVMDKGLQQVARAHSADMFQRRYFAHENPDGLSPFDRMRRAGISFRVAGENLAYAPNVEVAHAGLMDSPGHRANVLRPEFRRVGIGVMATTLYGRMYTQAFAD
ncbi:MAG: CvpA family protein [Chloroflexi bacterium]|nr:CvpA family protein [Chloroflexota bacterium]